MYRQEDEISLADLWRVLVKRKKIVFGLMLAFVVLGGAYAVLKTETYTFSTTIEIGTVINGDKENIIETAENALNKIKTAYIPFVLNQFYEKNPDNEEQYKIEASVPKGSDVLVIHSEGNSIEGPVYKELMDEVVQKLIVDHARIINLKKRNLERQIAIAENSLSSSKDSAKLLAAKTQRLNQMAELMRKQLNEKKILMENALKNRNNATSKNAAGAMTILLIDSEIQKYQQSIDQLENNLIIDISQQRDELEKEIADNLREQNDKQNNIELLKNQLSNISDTKAIVPVMKSIEPVGLSKKIIMILALVLGLFLGILGAFFYEFLDKIKKQEEA